MAASSSNGEVDATYQTTLSTLNAYLQIAKHTHKRHFLLKDETLLPFVVYVLDDSKQDVVLTALKILDLLTERESDACFVRGTFALTSALAALITDPGECSETNRNLAATIYDRISQEQSATDTGTEQIQTRPSRPLHQTSAATQSTKTQVRTAAEPTSIMSSQLCNSSKTNTNSSEECSRLSTKHKTLSKPTMFAAPSIHSNTNRPKFMSGAPRAKTHTFALTGLLTESVRVKLEQSLTRVRGVVSIYFDSHKSHAVIRARADLTVEVLAKALLEPRQLLNIALVTKNELAEEVLTNYCLDENGVVQRTQLDCDGVSPTQTAHVDGDDGYLNESFGQTPSPKKDGAESCLVRVNDSVSNRKEDDGWWGSVSSFVNKSFFW